MLLCVFVVLLQLIIFTDCGNWKIFSIKGGKVYVNSEASNWPQGAHCLTGFQICNVVADNTPTISQMVFTLKFFYASMPQGVYMHGCEFERESTVQACYLRFWHNSARATSHSGGMMSLTRL